VQGGGPIYNEARPTTLSAVAAEFRPTNTNSSRCDQFLAKLEGRNMGESAEGETGEKKNGQNHGKPAGGSTLIEAGPKDGQATCLVVKDPKDAKSGSSSEKDFPCITERRPIIKSVELSDSNRPNTKLRQNCYLTTSMQTLVSKRMSYLLKHAAYSEKVAMSPQGYVNISELIKW